MTSFIKHLLVFLIAFAPIASYSQENSKLNTRFLKEEPYRKAKQCVDLTQITSESDMAVIREAIDPMMRFMNILSQIKIDQLLTNKIITVNGLALLKLPPIQNESNRYVMSRMYNFRVINNQTISFSADRRDLLRAKEPYVDSYVFIKVDGAWKFDRHE